MKRDWEKIKKKSKGLECIFESSYSSGEKWLKKHDRKYKKEKLKSKKFDTKP